MRAVASAMVIAGLALTGCGSSSPAQPSASTFKSGFRTEKTAFRQLGIDLQQAITGAKAKTDAQLATELGALSGRASEQASRLAKLSPPARFTASLTRLTAGFHAVSADLKSIAAAAVKHDGDRDAAHRCHQGQDRRRCDNQGPRATRRRLNPWP